MVKIPTDDKGNLSLNLLKQAQTIVDYKKQNSGKDNSHIQEPHPVYHNPSDGEINISQGKNNQWIIIGRDRPRDPASGYGGQGDTHSACIDIIAGMTGRFAKSENKKKEKIFTNKSPELDAARIYISQKTDIDKNFSLKPGDVGNHAGKSGIAIKADGVRIIGREGIKLVTGTDVYNSQGIKVDGVMGIDLIAGNDDSDLQPLVKGNNLELALKEIIELISDLNGIMLSHFASYLKLLSSLAVHTHVSTLPGNPTSPSLDLATACVNELLFKSPSMMVDLYNHSWNCITREQEFLWPWGDGYINSGNNNTN
mgnify:CR=1 FL=1